MRRAQGATLEQLASDSGLSAGYLSQIETGTAIPSLTALQLIAAELGVDVTAFFPDERTQGTRLIRASERHEFRVDPGSGEEYAVLAGQVHDRAFSALYAKHEPGSEGNERPFRHLGEEFALGSRWPAHDHSRWDRVRARAGRLDSLLLPSQSLLAGGVRRTHGEPLAADAGGDLSVEPTTGESLGARVGTRLRQRRLELDRKLSEVAATADLSVGYLSSIEKGGKVPSLPVLARLAHALDMSLAEILRTSASSRLSRGTLTSRLGQERLNAEGSQLRIVRLSGKPGSRGKAPVSVGRGDVFVYVHAGELEIDVDGSVFELGPGDALHGDRPRSMTWRVTGEETATSVWAAAARPGRGARADGH